MSREIELDGRRYWILSEPCPGGWKARVVEVVDLAGASTHSAGVDAVAETRGAADKAAERKLRRLLELPDQPTP